MDISKAVQKHVGRWAGASVEPRGGDFVEFRVGRRELGHLHGGRLADLPFPVRVRERLVALGKAAVHYLHPETGWVSYHIRGEQDLDAIVELFRLNYERPWLNEGRDPVGHTGVKEREGPESP